LNFSRRSLTQHQMDIFWLVLIEQSLTDQVKDAAYLWLENSLTNGIKKSVILTEEIIAYLFLSKLPCGLSLLQHVCI